MNANTSSKPDFAGQVKDILGKEPGLSIKELAEKLNTNRQYMAGILRVLEERGEVTYRQVGPARIYYVGSAGHKEPG